MWLFAMCGRAVGGGRGRAGGGWSVDWAVAVLVAAAVPASVQQRKRQRRQVVVEAEAAAAVAVAATTVRIRGRCTSVSENGSSSVVYLGSVWVAVGGWLWMGRGIAPVLPPPPLSPPSLPSMKSEPQPSRLHLRDRLREEMSPPLDGVRGESHRRVLGCVRCPNVRWSCGGGSPGLARGCRS